MSKENPNLLIARPTSERDRLVYVVQPATLQERVQEVGNFFIDRGGQRLNSVRRIWDKQKSWLPYWIPPVIGYVGPVVIGTHLGMDINQTYLLQLEVTVAGTVVSILFGAIAARRGRFVNDQFN